MRLSDLEGKVVRAPNGEKLGTVSEVRIHRGRVSSLIYGARGLWQRLSNSRAGHRIPWERVHRVTAKDIWIV